MAEVKLNDISSNSDASRNNVTPEVDEDDLLTPVPVKRRSIFARGLNFFGVSTDFGGVVRAVWEEVIVPTFLDGCRDSMYTAADYIFGGGTRKSQGVKKKGKSGYTNYSAASKNAGKVRAKQPASNSYYIEYDERVSDDPDIPGAQDVLNGMDDVVSQVGFVTIQDMLTIAKKTTSNYMLGDWGWRDVSRAMVRRTTGGKYYIDLPRPEPIEDK